MKRTPLKRKAPLRSKKGLNKVGKMRNAIPPEQRARIWKRAKNKCERCGSKYLSGISHNRKKGMGGTTHIYTDDELELLCVKCHGEDEHGERVIIDTNPMWSK